eukprot:TRINITY_DN17238_c0_g1_i2.p1 TRINITY_DN17238_c0_g1~~TRINITY_DN17238_c0_g1_i2.p1  ORF type:complete len:362 (-),score=59.28 TRINITY_DN17238_c0_g1_i2:636-1721(-)
MDARCKQPTSFGNSLSAADAHASRAFWLQFHQLAQPGNSARLGAESQAGLHSELDAGLKHLEDAGAAFNVAFTRRESANIASHRFAAYAPQDGASGEDVSYDALISHVQLLQQQASRARATKSVRSRLGRAESNLIEHCKTGGVLDLRAFEKWHVDLHKIIISERGDAAVESKQASAVADTKRRLLESVHEAGARCLKADIFWAWHGVDKNDIFERQRSRYSAEIDSQLAAARNTGQQAQCIQKMVVERLFAFRTGSQLVIQHWQAWLHAAQMAKADAARIAEQGAMTKAIKAAAKEVSRATTIETACSRLRAQLVVEEKATQALQVQFAETLAHHRHFFNTHRPCGLRLRQPDTEGGAGG